MKCYKVKFLTKDELRRQLIIYAYSLKQAKALAEAYPLDDVNETKVRETKDKKNVAMMIMYVERYEGEVNLLKKELDVLNNMRICKGKDPIDTLRIMAMN